MNVLPRKVFNLTKQLYCSQIRCITSRAKKKPMKVQLKIKRPAEPVVKPQPPDDVYFIDKWRRNLLSVTEALEELRHIRELEERFLLDGEKNELLYATVFLNMRYTEPENNKRKYMGDIEGRLFYPCMFTSDWKVLAVVSGEEEEEMARIAGSDIIGGENLIPMIANDEIEFDFICATPTSVNLLTPVRKQLKEKFPSKKNGNLQNNIGEAVNKLKSVVLYKSKDRQENFTVPCGRVDFSAEDVDTNLHRLVKEMYKHRHAKIPAESYLTDLTLSTSLSSMYPLDITPYLPPKQQPKQEKPALPQWEEDLFVMNKLKQML